LFVACRFLQNTSSKNADEKPGKVIRSTNL